MAGLARKRSLRGACPNRTVEAPPKLFPEELGRFQATEMMRIDEMMARKMKSFLAM
jgi:hypothetical protein